MAEPTRSCTMCGASNSDCMEVTRKIREACCPTCKDGNTHPMPGEAGQSCAEWAEKNGGPTKPKS